MSEVGSNFAIGFFLGFWKSPECNGPDPGEYSTLPTTSSPSTYELGPWTQIANCSWSLETETHIFGVALLSKVEK